MDLSFNFLHYSIKFEFIDLNQGQLDNGEQVGSNV